MIWNPGDDTDLNEGGAGTDTVEVNGGNGAEAVHDHGQRHPRPLRPPRPGAVLDRHRHLREARPQRQRRRRPFSATGNLAALIEITVDGGAGNDTILGSNGIDILLGGDGNDFVDGQQGNDVAFLGAGDDMFQWDPGDGSDIVEGQDGTDTMLFNGSAGNEIFEASANGGRLRFTRNIANIVMDLNDVEVVDLNALGGTDTITVNDLSGTDVIEGRRRPRRHDRRHAPATPRPTPSSSTAPTATTSSTSSAPAPRPRWSGWRRRSTSPTPRAPTTRSSSTPSAATTA